MDVIQIVLVVLLLVVVDVTLVVVAHVILDVLVAVNHRVEDVLDVAEVVWQDVPIHVHLHVQQLVVLHVQELIMEMLH